MLVFLSIVSVFFLTFLITYIPVLRQYVLSNKAAKDFQKELNLLGNLYKKNVYIVTERLGEGLSQNSSLRFSEIHKNRSFAINSILEMLNKGDI